jgi:hypothetical protein
MASTKAAAHAGAAAEPAAHMTAATEPAPVSTSTSPAAARKRVGGQSPGESVVAKPVDQTPPKAPGSIVAAVPGAAAMSRLAVIDLEEQRADRSAQLRDEAL